MIRYKVKVINCPNGLYIRSGPGMSNTQVGWLANNSEHIINKRVTLADGGIWDQLENGKGYISHKGASGTYYTKTILDLNDNKVNQSNNAMQQPSKGGGTNQNNGVGTGVSKTPPASGSHVSGIEYNIPSEDEVKAISQAELLEKTSQIRGYPTYSHTTGQGVKVYDWSTDLTTFSKNFETIKRNNNISSVLNRDSIMTKTFENFNRFKVEYADYHLTKAIPYVFITRPSLNILTEDYSKLHEQVIDDPKFYSIFKENPSIIKSLTDGFSKSHDLNVILSERAESLEVMDEVLDTLETGETFSGYKIQYAKHNIKSITAGNMSIKYRDGRGYPITKMHQVWVDYMNQVYRGLLLPTDYNIYNKIIDYACSMYYFLLDSDGETIIFWSKYYGVFPLNVPKSHMSYDKGNDFSFPEVTVNYAYFYKEDLSPMALIEFNENTGGNMNFKYRELYEPSLGTAGKTWVGPAFVQSFTRPDGTSGFKLRHRHQ